MQWAKRVILVGGTVGTGNETVLGMLRQLGYRTIDADELARHLTHKGGTAYQRIVALLGGQFLDSAGELDRFQLYQAAAKHPRLMTEIQAIVSPLVQQGLSQLVQDAPQQWIFVKTNDLEAYGLREQCRQLWLVTATEHVQVANLVKNHRWALPLARRFAHSQAQHKWQDLHVDLALSSTGPRGALWEQLMDALRGLEAEQEITRPTAPVTQAGSPPEVPPSNADLIEGSARQSTRAKSIAASELKLIGRQIGNSALIMLALALLTSWGLLLAEYGRQHLPITAGQAVWQALLRSLQYLVSHPQTYYWVKEQVPWFELVSRTVGRSAGLLVLAMAVAVLLGVPLGIAAATARRKIMPGVIVVLSALGASMPSFLFAMLLWVVNISVHRYLGLDVLPSTGFGWDGHLVMPVLVLAMRPLAQLAQVTYITMSEVLRQDYVRVAESKGLAWHVLRDRHVLTNVLIPILNTLGASLRFSLASLPVVEIFFRWPGVGSMLLDAINSGTSSLVLDLILSLGLFFLLTNMLIEFCLPLIDHRLEKEPVEVSKASEQSLQETLADIGNMIGDWFWGIGRLLRAPRARQASANAKPGWEAARALGDSVRQARRRWVLRSLLRNPVLILSSILLAGLVALAVFGPGLTRLSPYELHGVMAIDGEYAAPPFRPSSLFPWGTDHIGRDIQSLVLAGAQKTLTLALIGTLARLALGSLLGIIAGWQRGGRIDRLVSGAMSIWAAFPATLFAMIVIQALGIQQGMWVFVVGICVVGWGEVAQFVRGQVVALKPRQFVESARTVGARTDQILVRHILPNIANPLLVLAALEMGGVLMLLAELGFLNIFMGGGFRQMIGESGSMQPIIAFYSDVPEWGALIANVRAQWRSYPWMALYPGLAVLISIVTFNLFGEGLRRFLDESAVSLSRLFNRYSFMAASAAVLALTLILRSSAPLSVYRAEGLKFDEQRVMNDIRILSSPQLQGRETGTPGATLAALYISRRMAEIGIFPAGEHGQYLQHLVQPRVHLLGTPSLAILGDSGQVVKECAYRQDFAEISELAQSRGEASGRVVGLAYGALPDAKSSPADLQELAAADQMVIVRADDMAKVNWWQVGGVLVIANDASQLERRDVYPRGFGLNDNPRPYMRISPELADVLLRTAGSSVAELDSIRSSLSPGGVRVTGQGTRIRMSVPAFEPGNPESEQYINVIGVIPGQGHFMGTEEQMVVVSAYYDGLGTDASGVVYPGADDNASGVAMMLELARLLKETGYQPDKTVLFVAWAGGERQEGLSVIDVQNARPGASEMNVESVLELSGVGHGTGKSISIGNDSSYRLVQLFQHAAGRYSVPTTTRGRGPHYGVPVRSMPGGRDAMTLSLSWDGSDDQAHTPQDTAALINAEHLRDIGRPAYLTLLVLSRETEY